MTPGHYVLISVIDNGTGMEKSVMDNIFEPFYTTKDVDKGTGLGLSTVYGIVKQNKGHITVYSEPGEGSVFKIYWPAVFLSESEKSQTKQTGKKSGKQETILLAEDNEIVRKVAVDVLKHANYNVIAVEDGVEALKKAEELNFKFDLLITDITMPRMTGNELAEAILKEKPDLKVLYATGYNENIFRKDGKTDSQFPIINKPFRPGEFIDKVSELLHGEQ
jgi:CheY-like chemotaxis protein